MHVGLVTGQRQVEMVEMPTPQPVSSMAVVDISYCGICGTDVHAYLSGAPYPPAICGHEWVGHVSAAANDVSNVKEGDRVAIGIRGACGECPSCRHGDTSHCQAVFASAIGMTPGTAPHGGFAPAIAMHANRLYHVPASLSDEQAGVLEPATVAVHALRRTPIKLGDNIAIIGAGPIGLLVLQAARLSGAGQIIVIEPEDNRRKLAGQLGADILVNPKELNTQATVEEHLQGLGADVVFECAGIASTIQTSADLARRGGIVSLVGVATESATIHPAAWLAKEISMVSSIAYLHEDFEICKQLVADGRIQTAPLHTSTVSLADLGSAFDRLAEHPSEIKILVDPRL